MDNLFLKLHGLAATDLKERTEYFFVYSLDDWRKEKAKSCLFGPGRRY